MRGWLRSGAAFLLFLAALALAAWRVDVPAGAADEAVRVDRPQLVSYPLRAIQSASRAMPGPLSKPSTTGRTARGRPPLWPAASTSSTRWSWTSWSGRVRPPGAQRSKVTP
jgi:hypothetical protein